MRRNRKCIPRAARARSSCARAFPPSVIQITIGAPRMAQGEMTREDLHEQGRISMQKHSEAVQRGFTAIYRVDERYKEYLKRTEAEVREREERREAEAREREERGESEARRREREDPLVRLAPRPDVLRRAPWQSTC